MEVIMKFQILTSLITIFFCSYSLHGMDIWDLAQYGTSDQVEQLIQDNPQLINAQNINKETPLHLAARKGRAEVVETLLAHGANVNLQDEFDRTPLHFAFNTNVVNRLLHYNAVIDARDKNFETPLDHAVKWSETKIVTILLNKGANVNNCSDKNWTPLHTAALEGNHAMAQLLLERGAHVNAQSRPTRPSGKVDTPLSVACSKASSYINYKKFDDKMTSLLLSWGANPSVITTQD